MQGPSPTHFKHTPSIKTLIAKAWKTSIKCLCIFRLFFLSSVTQECQLFKHTHSQKTLSLVATGCVWALLSSLAEWDTSCSSPVLRQHTHVTSLYMCVRLKVCCLSTLYRCRLIPRTGAGSAPLPRCGWTDGVDVCLRVCDCIGEKPIADAADERALAFSLKTDTTWEKAT